MTPAAGFTEHNYDNESEIEDVTPANDEPLML